MLTSRTPTVPNAGAGAEKPECLRRTLGKEDGAGTWEDSLLASHKIKHILPNDQTIVLTVLP